MDNREKTRSENYVEYVLGRKNEDNGFAARMRRADNRDMEDRSWDVLTAFGVNLELDQERLPFVLVGSALCKADIAKDGDNNLGASLAGCYKDYGEPGQETPGHKHLLRILGCSTSQEIFQTLRPLLKFINDKTILPLNHARLLDDILFFEGGKAERVKKRWAMAFYSVLPPEKSNKQGNAQK